MTREDTENNRRSLASAGGRSSGDNDNMEYAWLEPRHDPIATDTNLAEIDFEDFKNEDLAFAFSCGVSIVFEISISVRWKVPSERHSYLKIHKKCPSHFIPFPDT